MQNEYQRHYAELRQAAHEAACTNDTEAYVDFLAQLQERYPGDTWAFQQMAKLAEREHQWRTVLRCTRKVCLINPEAKRMRLLMAKALSKLGLYSEAEAQIKRLEREDLGNFGNAQLLFTHAAICADRGDLRRAAALLQEALEREPHNGEILVHLVRCLRKVGEVDRATQILSEHADYQDPYWLIEQARCLARKRRITQAHSLLKRATARALSHKNRESLQRRIQEALDDVSRFAENDTGCLSLASCY